MASLETLPPDQRAVLDLVLHRGRTYDDIARLLAIDRAAVRSRALAALDQLGPDAEVPPERRALITDYLLGQLPDPLAAQTRERLAAAPSERAWARLVTSELGSIATTPLPEVPSENGAAPEVRDVPAPAAAESAPPTAEPAPPAPRRGPRGGRKQRRERGGSRPTERPISRRGGAIMLAIGVLVAVAVVVLLVGLIGGKSKKHPSASAASPNPSASAASPNRTTTTAPGTSTGSAHIVGQINLNPPSGGSSTKGVAFVVKDGSAYGVILAGQGLAANKHNAYAVWLYNAPNDASRVGFVNPGVGSNGKLSTGGALPANAGHYRELLLTLETQSAPKTPGTIVLQGALKGVPAP